MTEVSNDICPLGKHLQHYWDRLSSEERKMEFDEEGLFSLTPRKIALDIADNTTGNIIVDAFSGVGGSAIGFALKGKSVMLPQGFPGNWNYWSNPVISNESENDEIDISKVEHLQISIRNSSGSDSEHGIEISSVSIKTLK